jgi:hypothetical protein
MPVENATWLQTSDHHPTNAIGATSSAASRKETCLMKSTSPIAIHFAAALAATAISAQAGVDFFTLQRPTTPGGIVAVSPVSDYYWKDTKVRVEAVPSSGYRFLGWTSGITSSKNPDSLLMNASKVVSAKFVDTANLVPYGGFEFGYTKWIRVTDANNPTLYTVRNGAACIDPSIASLKSYHIQFLYDLPRLVKGQKLTLSFKAQSTDTHRVMATLRNKNAPWNSLANGTWLTTRKAQQTFTVEFTATDSASAPRLSFDLGLDSSEICMDDIALRRYVAPVVQLGGFAARTAGLMARDGNIRMRTQGPGTWHLNGLDGKLIAQGMLTSTGDLDIANVPAGVGFLTIRTRQSLETYRIANF